MPVTDAFNAFKSYIIKGEINRAVIHAMDNLPSLPPYERDDCLIQIRKCLACGAYLTPETVSIVKSVVPVKTQQDYHLTNYLASPPFPPQLPLGRVFCLSALSTGHVHYLQVYREPPSAPKREILDPIGRRLFKAMENAYGFLLLWHPMKYDFRVVDCRGNEVPVTGRSLELALALALCSQITGRSVPAAVAASAVVEELGKLGKVEDLDKKLAALKREKDFVNEVLVAAGQPDLHKTSQRLTRVGALEEALLKVWPTLPVDFIESTDVLRELNELRKLYEGSSFRTCFENANRLIKILRSSGSRDSITKQGRQRAFFTCYWRRGSCQSHFGHPVAAIKDLELAMSFHRARKGVIDRKDLYGCSITLGVCLRDLFRYEEAEKLYREIDADLEGENLFLMGKGKSSLSQLLVAMGRFEEAEQLQKAAVNLVDDAEKPRNLYYLAQCYTAWGKFRLSASTLKKSRELHAGQSESIRKKSFYPFMDWVEAELHYRWAVSLSTDKARKPHWEKIEGIAKDFAYPYLPYVEEFIKRFHGLVLLQQGREEEGSSLLDQVVDFFDGQSEPMMNVLGALVLAEKLAMLLGIGDRRSILNDLGKIVRILSRHKQIREFFHDEIATASAILAKKAQHADNNTLLELLESIKKKIPY